MTKILSGIPHMPHTQYKLTAYLSVCLALSMSDTSLAFCLYVTSLPSSGKQRATIQTTKCVKSLITALVQYSSMIDNRNMIWRNPLVKLFVMEQLTAHGRYRVVISPVSTYPLFRVPFYIQIGGDFTDN